mgnify:CR=1 FL=1
MTATSTVKLLSPEEIATRQQAPVAKLRLADPAVFKERALRLRQLAAAHPMRDYLLFMADVADAQHTVLGVSRPVALPSETRLREAAQAGEAPLALPRWALDAAWQQELQDLLVQLRPPAASQTAAVLAGLQAAAPDELNQQAERLLCGIMLRLDLATAPLIGAALQVYWTRLVAQTQATFPQTAFAPTDNARLCPCCGSPPVASVVRLGSEEGSLRYLHCTLCQTEWHLVRIKCSHCESTKGIHYQELAPADEAPPSARPLAKGAVRAECCDMCGHYLKIVAMDKDPHVDPVADDLATVALDLLLSETGKQRHGVNYMLLWGEPEAAPETPPHQHAGAP